MKAIGIDIGTTTVCGVVIDGKNGEVLFSRTLPNDSGEIKAPQDSIARQMARAEAFEKTQHPERIWECVGKILEEMAKEHPQVDSIGLTGQMHGILYVNQNGEAVSPLYTWQDESGNQPLGETPEAASQNGEKTCASYLSELTGSFMATGFGLTTYYCHSRNHKVPEAAARLCTIHDYVGMRLTGARVPLISPSDGASLGLYDSEKNEFDWEKIEKAGMDAGLLPEVKSGYALVGTVQKGAYAGVPVSIGLGDNQASVIGSVKNIYETVLVNIGTGSQISVGVKQEDSEKTGGKKIPSGLERRPLVEKDFIYAGSCLCGGRAYAALESFFRQVCRMTKNDKDVTNEKPEEKLYGAMAKLLEETKGEGVMPLTVNPQFCGTRENPELRGSITGIDLENLTPQAFIRGFLYGIAGELYAQYEKALPLLPKKPAYLVGSGNGIRMNPALQKILEELFSCPLRIPAHTEEAAYGTALFSLVAAGRYETLEEAQQVIRYL